MLNEGHCRYRRQSIRFELNKKIPILIRSCPLTNNLVIWKAQREEDCENKKEERKKKKTAT